MTFLYNCKSEIGKDGALRYRITKFDDAMNVESSYITDGVACDCPAGQRPTCRHRQMLPRFKQREAVNTEWFYDFDRGGWVQMGEPTKHGPIPLPKGVTMISLDEGPEAVWNAIADAVGEPRSPERPKSVFIRRRL